MAKFKRLAQSLTTSRSKHGHREVISVFVCTGKNKYGVICHNFEKQISLSPAAFTQKLREKTIEELSVRLLNYCLKEFTVSQVKLILKDGDEWMRLLAEQMKDNENIDEVTEKFFDAAQEDKEKIIRLIVTFWQASGQSDILPTVNSSLLVFKHHDSASRQQFLNAYLDEVKVTEGLHAQGKYRASTWAAFKTYFFRSSQDLHDRDKSIPAEGTICSRHLMQVLNHVDPDLVNRGRNVMPKSLEAGLREASHSKSKETPNHENIDDFEQLIAAQEQLLSSFKMVILPSTGTELMQTLLTVIDQEIHRIEHKFWANAADKQKAADLKKLLLPYRNPAFQSYPVILQVDITLELLATALPVLQRKTGLLGSWISSTSYDHVRAFARTQGIFDGDIREATEKFKNKPLQIIEDKKNELDIDNSITREIYIFSDWSFGSWSSKKRELLLAHMIELITKGCSLYIWDNGQLTKMTKQSLQKAFNEEDFDNLLVSKLKPVTRTTILDQAKHQHMDISKIQFLDYKKCKIIANDQESIAVSLNRVAPLLAEHTDEYYIQQTKRNIIDIEIANAEEKEQAELGVIKESIPIQKSAKEKTYQSGIDTKALTSQPQYRKPIFKPVDFMTPIPSVKYYRNEVYTDLFINNNPSSPFQYFELLGMDSTENLIDCKYKFYAHGITLEVIQKRKAESKQTLFRGNKDLTLTEEWKALPSLNPNEKLLDIAINGLKRKDFEIKYSRKNHLYKIRLTQAPEKPKHVSVDLLLRMPKRYRANPIFNTIAANPKHQEIHCLLMKYLKFGKDDGALRDAVDTTVHNGHEYLNEARKLKVASCRLRAIAFKEEMTRLYPEILVSISVNPNHCFIEMELDGEWQSYCLGGYRDVPNFAEVLKDNALESCGYGSKKHRFFTDISKPKHDTAIEMDFVPKPI